jgi:diguanylate cyclase (GGDEF)-like protein
MKTLIIDDDSAEAATLKQILENGSIEVHCVPRSEALTAFREEKPGMVVLSPGEGFPVLKDLQGSCDEQHIPLLLVGSKTYTIISETGNMDLLTGIPNRKRFEERLEVEWKRGAREGRPLGMLLIDIDNFEAIGREFGSEKRDTLLKNFGSTLVSLVRQPVDLAAHFTAEHFAVLLPDTAIAQCLLVAERIKAIGARLESSATVGLSIGAVAIVPTPSLEHTKLIAMAQSQLDQAKAAGGNCIKGIK